MRYADMTERQRELLFANPDNYPFRVSFLGKTGLLSAEAIALLRRHDVDFSVDDAQAASLLAEAESAPFAGGETAAEPVPTNVPGSAPAVEPLYGRTSKLPLVLAVVGIAVAVLRQFLLRRAGR